MFSTLVYHQQITEFLRAQPAVWSFFAGQLQKEEQLQELKADLLKNTYKFDPMAEAPLYEKLALACEKLGLDLPVTLYQALHSDETSAAIIYTGREAHIVFYGKIIQLLTDEELLAIIAHELGHVHLCRQLNGDVEIAHRIVTAVANHPGASAAHYESARLFKLYAEIFCDRAGAFVAGHYAPIIAALVKMATGLQTVNVESYVRQAEEIFTHEGGLCTTGITHPENFIRARALHLWHNKAPQADDIIRRMIEGHTSLDGLDLLRQQELSGLTRRLLQLALQPPLMQTETIVALVKQYFATFDRQELPDADAMTATIGLLHESAREYLSYVLYDMATADPQQEDLPLGYCFRLAAELGLDKSFVQVVKKERKLSDKKTKALQQQCLSAYEKECNPASAN